MDCGDWGHQHLVIQMGYISTFTVNNNIPYTIHKMVMMKAESDVFTTLLRQCPQPNLSQGFISAFRTLSAQIDGWQEQDCKAMSCRILQTDM